MNTSEIQLDDTKSPAVVFATLADGTVLACEPDGSRVIGVTRHGLVTHYWPLWLDEARDVLTTVAAHARRVRR